VLQFRFIFPKFGCRGNSFSFLEKSHSIFEFADPYNPVIHAKKSLQFWLIFAQILLPWQLPLLPWKFR